MRACFFALASLCAVSPALASPTFILNDIGGVGAGTQARAAFAAAAALWASAFTNNVTIVLDVGFQNLGTGILGESSSTSGEASYRSVRAALAKRTTAADRTSYASLAPTLAFESNTANGITNATTHVFDSNASYDNINLSVSTANEKALGLIANNNPVVDASITFSNRFKFTFNATGGVAAGTYDFIGIAAHEIGHALGFVSGVDTADYYAKFGYRGLDQSAWGTPLDLFRYQNGRRDWTVGGTPCFSTNGGRTCNAKFATGYYEGDHYQASHWKNGLKLGIMNPSIAAGTRMAISGNDLAAFDAIGWNLAAHSAASGTGVHWGRAPNGSSGTTTDDQPALVPEPSELALIGLAMACFGVARACRNKPR